MDTKHKSVLPQPPRPSHGFIDFVPDPSNSENGSTGERIHIGQLCGLCAKIRDWLIHIDSCDKRRCKTRLLYKDRIPHHDTPAKLEESFKNGCHMCTHIWCSFVYKINEPYDVQLLRRGRRVWLTFNGSWLVAHIRVHQEEWAGEELHLQSMRAERPSTASDTTSSSDSYGTSESDEEESEDEDGDLGRPQLAAVSYTKTAAAASFELVKRWMRQCIESHQICQEKPVCALPRRLLKVSHKVTGMETTRMVHLVDVDSLPATNASDLNLQYAALSYCWGRSAPYTLTATTEQVLRDGILIDRLPRTIQHATYTTLELGLEWLWVDSLCIFQDSAEDWSREARAMFDVYQGSHITIAALGASDNSHGLFAHRDPLMYAPCPLIPRADGSYKYLYPVWGLGIVIKAWPLHQRGWVVQERVLPPRTANFGPFVSWECRELTIDEFDFTQREDSNPMREMFHRSIHKRLESAPNDTVSFDQGLIHKTWREILNRFSKTSLSFQSDRLQAISGIISGIRRRTGWNNVSGLWVPFIIRELLWKSSYSNHARTGPRPSWSWISVDGEVSGGSIDGIGAGIDLAEVNIVHRDDSAAASPTIEVLCVPLRVEMRMVPRKVFWEEDEYELSLSDPPLWKHLKPKSEIKSMTFFPDIFQEPVAQPELFLPLERNHDGGIWGLAVKLSEVHGSYERVGRGCIGIANRHMKKWERRLQDPMTQKVITLV